MAERDTVRLVARLLTVGIYTSVALAVAGTLLMLFAGHVPVTERGPAFVPGHLVADLLAGRASGFLWAGLVVAGVLPSARVAVAGRGYGRAGAARPARGAFAVLGVLAVSTIVALVTR